MYRLFGARHVLSGGQTDGVSSEGHRLSPIPDVVPGKGDSMPEGPHLLPGATDGVPSEPHLLSAESGRLRSSHHGPQRCGDHVPHGPDRMLLSADAVPGQRADRLHRTRENHVPDGPDRVPCGERHLLHVDPDPVSASVHGLSEARHVLPG